MKLWKQAILALALLAVAAVVWARNFPVAAGFLERAGIAIASVEPRTAVGDGPRGAGRGAGETPVVIGAPVVQATINDAVSAIGDGRAARSVTVTPYVAGRVASLEVESGDEVTEGAPLVRLDSEAEEIALDRARLTLEDARSTLARTEDLVKSGATTEVQLRSAQLAVSQGELALRDAELALEHRVIRAPFDGWVGILGVDVGDQVSIATEITTLDDRSHILVDFRVPERFVGQVKVGAPVSAEPLGQAELALTGAVVTLDSRIAPDTRTLRVRASLDNAEDRLRAGMAFSISMRFPGEVFPAVDPLAIQWGAEGAFVWVAREGAAARVPVRVVQRNSDTVLVAGELVAGDRVITEGVQRLRPGSRVAFEGEPAPGAETES